MFDPYSITLNGKFKPVIDAAREAGWEFKKAGNGGVRVMFPGDKDLTFYLPITSRNPDNLVKAAMRLIKTSEHFTATDAIALMDGKTDALAEGTQGPNPTIKCRTCGAEFTDWVALSTHVATEHDEAEDMTETLAQTIDEAATIGLPDVTESATVVRRPYLAVLNRLGNGTVQFYESETTVQVENQDGEVQWWECAACDERFDNPESVPSHFTWHVRRGEVDPVTEEREVAAVEEGGGRRYRPKVMTKHAGVLVNEIYRAIRSNKRRASMTDSVYAQVLATHIIDHREAGVETEDAEPQFLVPSGEDVTIIDQIRALIGAPDNSAEVEQLTQERDEALARAERAEGNIKALRDMLADDK